ncbi:hypothetical protein PV726_06115 [Streptomyces europaeiscabiei]|uniref:hypothetical protein n=1 Tax=Streptomyces europaeiscabiei TaxID=146819 RepID=UPI0029A625AD|nr:hypothetical protein [Streptomyces europaeiscabiei]MDX3689917.1 hypothetical protein [Streptomyces europaeiscabiei]
MNKSIRTFSGAHSYRPSCVIDAARLILDAILGTESPVLAARVAERVTLDLVDGRCPRCRDPLMPELKPADWKPAGSRALPCRCLPVCETCASWIEPVIGVSPVTAWPTDTDVDDGRPSRKEFEQQLAARMRMQATAAVLDHGPSGLVLLTEDGVVSVAERPRPGGWLEHGYDDTRDEQERRS